MAQHVRLKPEELKSKSKEYNTSAENIDQILKNLERLNTELADTWEGDGFDGYLAQFTDLKPKVENFRELMNEIAGQLVTVADKFAEFDEQVNNSFGFNK